MNLFSLDHVSFNYASIEALRNVSLSLDEEGAILLGANGSGKSTLLALLDCLLFPQAGTVRFMGHEISESSFADKSFAEEFRRRVGFMFQNPDVQLFCPTVADEVAFGPLQLGLCVDEVERRVKDTLSLVGITHLAGRTPYSLSGGEKKKAALASILSVNPEILLLDEPTGNLDPRTTAWLTDLLCELSHQGTTVVMATHDLEIAQTIGGKAVVMGEDHGIKAQGGVEDILSDRKLLTEANLIHEHAHAHSGSTHVHGHGHFADHTHDHASDMKGDGRILALESHIAECLRRAREMRVIAGGLGKSQIVGDITRMQETLVRMRRRAGINGKRKSSRASAKRRSGTPKSF